MNKWRREERSGKGRKKTGRRGKKRRKKTQKGDRERKNGGQEKANYCFICRTYK